MSSTEPAAQATGSLFPSTQSLNQSCITDDEDGAANQQPEQGTAGQETAEEEMRQRTGKGRPHLRDSDKMRIMFLFADWFRETPDNRTWKKAAQFVAESYSKETGIPVATSTLIKLVQRLSKPVAQWKAIPPRGRVSTITDEFKEQVAFVLADPDIPVEKKSLRKIREFLPECTISKTTLRRVFIEMKKDKLLPKPEKQPRRRKTKASATASNSQNGHS